MVILRNMEYDWLFRQLLKYNSFSDNVKRKILYISIKNLMYILHKEEIEETRYVLDNIFNLDYAISDIRNYFEIVFNVAYNVVHIETFSDLELCCEELYDIAQEINDYIGKKKTSKRDNISKRKFLIFNKAVGFNLNLAESGICPLILYAFDKWQLHDKKSLSQVIELSLMYLYRYECYACKAPIGYELFKCSGATCNIFLDYIHNRICKVAKNFASSKYLLQQEYENATNLVKTELNSFLPKDYEYNKECGWLSHANVMGDCADELLVQRKISQDMINQLGIFYDAYINRKNKELILDIHPGNFIWDINKKKLYLVDCGAIARIGSEYYEYINFEEYYKKVWIDRVYNMGKYPIRSMDLCIDNKFKRNYGFSG